MIYWDLFCFRWIHDYQDACIEKLERFLRGEVNTSTKRAGLFQMGSSTEGMIQQAKYSSSSSPSDSPNSDCSEVRSQIREGIKFENWLEIYY